MYTEKPIKAIHHFWSVEKEGIKKSHLPAETWDNHRGAPFSNFLYEKGKLQKTSNDIKCLLSRTTQSNHVD